MDAASELKTQSEVVWVHINSFQRCSGEGRAIEPSLYSAGCVQTVCNDAFRDFTSSLGRLPAGLLETPKQQILRQNLMFKENVKYYLTSERKSCGLYEWTLCLKGKPQECSQCSTQSCHRSSRLIDGPCSIFTLKWRIDGVVTTAFTDSSILCSSELHCQVLMSVRLSGRESWVYVCLRPFPFLNLTWVWFKALKAAL